MKNEPLVTILVPAYNHEDFIYEVINSIISQPYKNIEVIITNDGSTDNTHDKIMELYEKCEKRFVSFKYINKENEGLLKSLKDMESLINGKYLTIFYSDDIYTENRIQKQVDALENNKEYALCYGKMIGIDKDSNIIKRYKSKHCKSGYVFDKLLERNFIPAPTVMIRTEVFNSVGGFDLTFIYDDYPLWLKIAHDNKILFLDEDLIYYRTHDNNISSGLIQTITTVEKILLTWNDEPVFNSVMKKFYLKSFYELVRSHQNYKKEAKNYMMKALSSWYHPKFIKAVLRYYFKKY